MAEYGAETWELILALFPFAVAVDGDGDIVRVGPRMTAVSGLSIGDSLDSGLTQVSPRRPFAVAEARRRSTMLITLATGDGLRFRGQCIPWGGSGALFVGGPRVTSMDDVQAHGLKLTDFPPHDPRLDLLILVSTKETALQDARRLTGELQRAKAEIETRAEELSAELVRREAATSLGRLVAGVAHEVNTPLGVSLTALSVLQESVDSLDTMFESGAIRRSTLNEALASIRSAAGLVNQNLERAAELIRDFKQVAVDQSHQEARRVEVGPYVEQVAGSLAPLFKGTEVRTLVTQVGDTRCETAPGALSQLITILVENAVLHAFPSGEGTIRIDITGSPQGVRVVVADDGIGMPPEVLRQATAPFFTTRGESGGTGLGLFILQRLATEVLQGHMALASEPGVGTTVTLDLPRRPPGPQSPVDENAN